MKNLKLSLVATLALAGMSWGTTISGNSLQTIIDNITEDGSSSVNVNTDQIELDSYWRLTASGGSVSTMIIEVAGFASTNEFGIYDAANPANKVTLFYGANASGDQATVSIRVSGKVIVGTDTLGTFAGPTFGYFLKSPDGTFYSDAALNPNSLDHMVAVRGTGDMVQLPGYFPGEWTANEYILGWEDLANPDNDFDDMVVMVESVKPVPEPTTMGLMGLGLLGLGLMARRNKKV